MPGGTFTSRGAEFNSRGRNGEIPFGAYPPHSSEALPESEADADAYFPDPRQPYSSIPESGSVLNARVGANNPAQMARTHVVVAIGIFSLITGVVRLVAKAGNVRG